MELTAEQWPWLVEELEEVRGPLEEELRRLWALHAAGDDPEVDRKASSREYELRLVRMMRAQLPAADDGTSVVFVGPAELVREVVRAVLTNVANALSENVRDVPPTDGKSCVRLIETAAAVAAWHRLSRTAMNSKRSASIGAPIRARFAKPNPGGPSGKRAASSSL
jgi:hypothetical protein